MSSPEQLIFIVGPAGSGKDTLGDWLERHHGFCHLSLSTKLGEHAATQQNVAGSANQPRVSLRALGQQLREKHGADILVRECIQDWEGRLGDTATRKLVITGHATPEETDAIRYRGGVVVELCAPPQLRCERTAPRDRGTGKQATPGEFLEQDRIDRLGLGGAHTPYDEQAVRWARDRTIDVSRPLEHVYAQLEGVVEAISQSDTMQRLAETPHPPSHWDIETDGYLRERYAQYHAKLQ